MLTANAVKMKTQVQISYNISRFACPLETEPMEDKGNGNRNSPPAPNLRLRPISVLSDWGPASYKNSRLPSSLEDWLASKDALMLDWPLTGEPAFLFGT
jgi:hypothetical protein